MKPHRLERYMASDDPELKPRRPTSSDSIFIRRTMLQCSASMKRQPFKHWIVSTRSCRSPRGAPSVTVSRISRHGTLSLYAALDRKSGRVTGKTAARHTSRDFVGFLREVIAWCPSDQEIHIILDSLSAHKTQAVREFLEQNPRVRFYFTPPYSSWLNQVEIWFAKIERDVIARGIFTSVSDLARKLRRYINAYSANPRPIQWKYSDTSRRIRTNEFTATRL
jgi:transposase